MSFDIPLSCRCGNVRGMAHDVAPAAGFRLVCYCTDCQAFARFLERPDMLDEAGGTDIFQMAAGRVKLTAGADAVRSSRFSSKVFRWYSECCRTSLANTASGRCFPALGLIHSFIGDEIDGPSRDDVLGPPLCRIHEGSATAALPAHAPPPASLGIFALRAAKVLGWWARGLGRPNPFFDDRTKGPISAPRVITPSERAAL
jgi:hypothetical protein